MLTTDCAIIILAAGNSSRLGASKQLLLFKNKTLLQRTIDEAVATGIGEIVVVMGANYQNILSSLSDKNIHVVFNERWQQGITSSIQGGLSALLAKQPHLSSVIVMLCDQPFVSSGLLEEMMAKKTATGKGIIACEYEETAGVPALFSSVYFDALLSLQGTDGAKKIINSYKDDVAVISFPKGAIDIDTQGDYEDLVK